MPQEIGFHDDLSVRDTMGLYRRIRKVSASEGAELLDRVGLSSHTEKQVRQLSGGLRQRLALAIALLGDPEVLLLDEPTANLDAGAREDFLRILEDLRDGSRAFIFASHRPGEVYRLADRVIVLHEGQVVRDARPAEALGDPSNVVSMRIELEPDLINPAEALLTERGFRVTRNHVSIRVAVPADSKATPLNVLSEARIAVSDFTLEDSNNEAD